MSKRVSLFILVQVLSFSVGSQLVWLQTNPLPCTTEGRDPSRPWDHNHKVLDSFPKDDPLPSFVGMFRDRNQDYMLDLYQDSKGVFGELSSPVLDADSPTSRLYDVTFDSRTGSLQFTARFYDGQLEFSGILHKRTIKATVIRNNRSERVTLKRKRHSSDEEILFTSRAQFECAMKLGRRF
jgi:hypothetical protein